MRLTKWVTNAALTLVSLCTVLILAEFILRVFYPQQLGVWNNLRDGMVIHPPNISVYLNRYGHAVQFNSIGMRDREHPIEKEQGVFRILLLGDSFMEALQVAFEESLPKLLEDRLRAATRRPIEVINFAVSGWGTDDQLEYLEQYGLKFQPDLILIAMTIHNDVSDNLGERFHTLVEGKLVARPKQEIASFEYITLKVKDFLASHFHLTQLLRKYKHRRDLAEVAESLNSHLLQLVRKAESRQIGRGWEITFQLFSRIDKIGKKVRAKTAIFLIPLSIQLYDHAFKTFLLTHGVSRSEIDLEKPQQKMRQFGDAAGIEVIDLLPDFRAWRERNQEGLHVADGHWNADGHQLAADVVSKELVRRGIFRTQ